MRNRLVVQLIATIALLAGAGNCLSVLGQGTDGIVKVGAGSYTTRLPAGAKEPKVAPFITASVHKPVPTNDWWSSLVFSRYSNQMFPHPLGIQAHDRGLRIYYPGAGYTANSGGVFTSIMNMPNDLVIGHSAQETFPDARVEGWSDWFVNALFADQNNQLHLTFGHGSPFVYGTIQGGNPTFTFGKTPVIFEGKADTPTLGVNVGGRNYGLFGPAGCHWEGIGTNRLVCVGKPYFSVALLPDNRPATLSYFARFAHNHVTDTRVTWSYDEKSAQLTTRYAITTKAMEGSNGDGTLFGLYPHQQQRTAQKLTDYSYQTIRGTLKLAEGHGFTTITPFQGVLPLLPNYGDDATLQRYLDADATGFKPNLADTYWTGKALGKLATLASIADVTRNQSAKQTFIARLKTLLEDYFSATKNGTEKTRGVFYYNRAWGTLIGYPASYGSDEALNDHHFHYGYFIRAAAEVARVEPEWAKPEKWGGMVQMLIRDCACPDHDDAQFPLLRNFDIYEGHSWADGKGDFADGNNNESSSEAMNAWTGMILWGAMTGDKKVRDTGIYLYVTEKDAIDNYWFDVHHLYPKTMTVPMVSMVWGAKAVYATWFSGDPITMHGINMLPIQSGSLYLGTYPEAVGQNIVGLTRERIARDKKDAKRDQSLPPRVGSNWGGWGDIILMYQALADPVAARKDAHFDTQEMEGGNSRANFYLWLNLLDRVGQVDYTVTADTPLYAVFKNGSKHTYMAYNTKSEPGRVRFSDGTVLEMKGIGMFVK